MFLLCYHYTTSPCNRDAWIRTRTSRLEFEVTLYLALPNLYKETIEVSEWSKLVESNFNCLYVKGEKAKGNVYCALPTELHPGGMTRFELATTGLKSEVTLSITSLVM